jgi:hypothetical protein
MATAPATPINRNDDWKDVHAPEMFTFERVDDSLLGEYQGPAEVTVKGKPTTQYVIKCGDGKVRTCLATYDLQRKMTQVEVGRQVRIIYEGEDHTIQTQGSPMRKFRVSCK